MRITSFRRPARAAAVALLAGAAFAPSALADPMMETETLLTAAPQPVVTGAPITYTATVTAVLAEDGAVSTGTVRFSNDGDPIDGCTAVPVNASGVATCETTAPAERWRTRVQALYLGDGGWSDSANFPTVDLDLINKTVLNVESDPAWTRAGLPIKHTATFDDYPFGGKVTFKQNGTPIAGCIDIPLMLAFVGGRSAARGASGYEVPCATVAAGAMGDYEITAEFTPDPLHAVDTPATATGSYTVLATQLTTDPGALNFGDVAVGTSAERTITVSNAGNALLQLGRVSLIGNDAGEFEIVSEDCSNEPIAPHGRSGRVAGTTACEVTVRFTPASAGARYAKLVFASEEDPDVPVAVSGTGTVPAPAPAPAPEAPKAEQPQPEAPKAEQPRPVTGAILDPSVANKATQGTITKASRLTLPLRCPTWMPCTVKGRVITDAGKVGTKGEQSKAGKRRVRHLIQYRDVAIGSNATVKVSGKVGAQARKLAARNKRRVIDATLVIDTVLQDGTKFTSKQQIKLKVAR